MTISSERGPSIETAESENVLSLKDIFRIVWRRMWVVVLMVIVAVGLAVGYALLQTPQYEASIRILIGQESGIVENPGDAQGLRDLTQTLAQAVRTRPVAEAVIQQENLNISAEEFIGARLSVDRIPETQFIEVVYEDPDPETARTVANAVGDVFSERVSEISPDAGAVTATVWERAAVPEGPVSPNPQRNAAAALIVGAILGVGLAFLLEYLDDSWRSPEEAEQVSGVPTFGVIPRFEAPGGKKEAGRKKKNKRKDQDVSYAPEGKSPSETNGRFERSVRIPDRPF